MKSKITKDLDFINGAWTLVTKEYPNYCGLEDIGFIYTNHWEDPKLEYNGLIFNIHDVKDYLYDLYREEGADIEFTQYVNDNADIVYGILDNLIYERWGV